MNLFENDGVYRETNVKMTAFPSPKTMNVERNIFTNSKLSFNAILLLNCFVKPLTYTSRVKKFYEMLLNF